jgi:nucleoside-diphosphate-sugar epimerase
MDAYQPERLALTGATGALGFAFLKTSFQRNPKLKATMLVRRASASFQTPAFQEWLSHHSKRVTLVDGDVRRPGKAQLEPLLACDGGLWHFAALTALTAENEAIAREIHAVNLVGTERLLEAWQNHPEAGTFYHISTAYVAGKRNGRALESENAVGQAFRNPYEASKLAAELSVQKAFNSGMRGTILRPSVVVDDHGGTGGIKMVDACAYGVALAVKRKEPFVFRMKRTANINLIHNDWVIAAMLDLARLPSGPGKTYHLSSPIDTYFRDIAAILEKVAPGLKVSFSPELTRAELPTASKIFDKAVTEIRPYFDADIHFDRSETDRDLSARVKELPLDLAAFVENRLKAEMHRVAHRK